MANITILGSGGFGIGLAVMLHKHGHHITVWSKFQKELDDIRKNGEQVQKLPGVVIPPEIGLSASLECIRGSDLVLFGIPSSFVRSVAREASPYITSDMVVVNTGKGLEDGSMKLLSEVLTEEIPQAAIVVLTGPSHAEEVGRCISTAVVAASKSAAAAAYVQETLSNQCFRIYENDDIVGCELGGALKNIIALCAGICDGLGYGDNTKAALMTRGIHEIARLGVAMGARAATFSGLAGIGDLIVTCTSMHSRNRRAGILIGEGVKPEDAVKQVGTVEGYFCCHVAYKLAQQMGVDMPITEQLYHVLFEGSDVRDALGKLMSRPSRHENEECSYLRDMMN